MGISNTVQQLSVFLENREGRLDEVLAALAKGGVNIVALSLADTSEYGMLRMIVSDPHKGRMVLKEEGITAMLTDVVALRVPHATGSLQGYAPACGGRGQYRVHVRLCQWKRRGGSAEKRRAGKSDRHPEGKRL